MSRWALVALLVFASVLDLATTRAGIAAGALVEANPLVAGWVMEPYAWVIKAGVPLVLGICVVVRYPNRLWYVWAPTVVFLAASLWAVLGIAWVYGGLI